MKVKNEIFWNETTKSIDCDNTQSSRRLTNDDSLLKRKEDSPQGTNDEREGEEEKPKSVRENWEREIEN